MSFPTAQIKSYFETGDKPSQDQFSEFIDAVGDIDANSPKNNFTATSDPTANDDANDGYAVGSRWVNTSTQGLFECVVAAIGGAVWKPIQTGSAGTGTVTSIGVSAPSEFSVSGSPVTTSGTISISKTSQAANRIYAGPSSGADAAPSFRAIATADLGSGSASAGSYLAGDLSWKSQAVLQIKNAIKTDTQTSTSASWVDVLTVSITPNSASSKVLVQATISGAQQNGSGQGFLRLVRDSTPIGVGDAAGSRIQAGCTLTRGESQVTYSHNLSVLDSPATTSAITYRIQVYENAATAYINRSASDTNDAFSARGVTTITAMEVTA